MFNYRFLWPNRQKVFNFALKEWFQEVPYKVYLYITRAYLWFNKIAPHSTTPLMYSRNRRAIRNSADYASHNKAIIRADSLSACEMNTAETPSLRLPESYVHNIWPPRCFWIYAVVVLHLQMYRDVCRKTEPWKGLVRFFHNFFVSNNLHVSY